MLANDVAAAIVMKTWRCCIVVSLALAFAACGPTESTRARAERVAQDTTRRAWRYEVGVDSVQRRGDTTIVWVSPRGWMATDAPQAGVGVAPNGRVVSIHWVHGG